MNILGIFGDSVVLFFKNLWYILKLGFVQGIIILALAIPALIGFILLAINKNLVVPMALLGIISFIGVLVALLIFTAVTATLVWTIVNENHESIKDLLSLGKKRTMKVIGASFLSGLFIVVGYMLLVIPGIIFSVWYAFVLPVVIDQGDDPNLDALKVSKNLVAGHFWPVLGSQFLIFLLSFAVGFIIGLAKPYVPTTALSVVQYVLTTSLSMIGMIFTFNLYKALKPKV